MHALLLFQFFFFLLESNTNMASKSLSFIQFKTKQLVKYYIPDGILLQMIIINNILIILIIRQKTFHKSKHFHNNTRIYNVSFKHSTLITIIKMQKHDFFKCYPGFIPFILLKILSIYIFLFFITTL